MVATCCGVYGWSLTHTLDEISYDELSYMYDCCFDVLEIKSIIQINVENGNLRERDPTTESKTDKNYVNEEGIEKLMSLSL